MGKAQMSVTDAEGKILYGNGFITDFKITGHNVVAIAAAGRAGWKIENKNNNTLKKIGPHAKRLCPPQRARISPGTEEQAIAREGSCSGVCE